LKDFLRGKDKMNKSLQNGEPMNQRLLQWTKDHGQDFALLGISLEIRDHTNEIEEKKLQNPVQVVFFDRKECMGEMRVWMSGIADFEILNGEGNTIYYKHYDDIKGETFESISQEFFRNLCE
jgi:hypothetical protein